MSESNNDQVIQELNQQIEEQRAKNDQAGLVDSLTRLGSHYLNAGDAPKALTHVEEAISLTEALNDQINLARLLGVKGLALVRIGNPKQALQSFNKSRKLAEKIQHLPITIDAYSHIGKLQFETGETEKGIKNLEFAYRTAFELGDTQREMYIAGLMANVFLVIEQAGKAMEFFSIALDAAKTMGKKEAECQYQVAIGRIYMLKEDYGPAEEHFKNVLDIGTRLANQNIQFSAFENLLQLSIRLEDAGMVRFNGAQALRLAREINDPGAEAENIRLLAGFLLEQAEYEQAKPVLQRGLELAKEVHDQGYQIDMLTHLGLANYFTGDLARALDLLLDAYQLATQLQDAPRLAEVGARLSVVKAELGDLNEAVKYAQEAIAVAEVQGLYRLQAEQHVMLGMTLMDLDKPEEARQQLEQAGAIYRQYEMEELLEQVEEILSQIG